MAITQEEAVKLMEKLQKLASKRMKLESKAAEIIAKLSQIAQAGGHEVPEFIEKTGFARIPIEGGKDYENKQDDPIPPEYAGDIRGP
jgi:hypothetical protein